MVRCTSASNRMGGCQQFAMLLHLFSAEQLGTKRCFPSVRLWLPKAFAQASRNSKQISLSLSVVQQIISFLKTCVRPRSQPFFGGKYEIKTATGIKAL